MLNRRPVPLQTRFLWGGIAMVSVGIGLALVAVSASPGGLLSSGGRFAEGIGDAAYVVAGASFALFSGMLLLLFRVYLIHAADAVRRLSDAVRSHGGSLPDPPGLRETADAALQCLDRYRRDITMREARSKEDQERLVRENTEAHRDLLTHHLFTKKMLQSRHSGEVFETLLKGVREGLGFSGAVLGILDEKGVIAFGHAGNGYGRGAIRIPVWEEDSVLARTVWSGNTMMLPSLNEQKSCREDRAVLGEGPALLVPVSRRTGRKCSEVKACGSTACPAYDRADAKCWIEGFSACPFHCSVIPEEKRKACARCEMFAPSAILVVRSDPRSRKIIRETTGSILTLVNEAALALEAVKLYEDTIKMSVTDGLTGLTNYREFYQCLGKELERARRYGHTISLLMVDVDDFKKFNDRYGHLEGDFALKKIASLLSGCVRTNDVVARYGGEEFVIIMPESTPAGALMLAERIKTEIAQHDFRGTSGESAWLTVSIGVYTTDQVSMAGEHVVRFADEALYMAKFSGKNCVVLKAHA